MKDAKGTGVGPARDFLPGPGCGLKTGPQTAAAPGSTKMWRGPGQGRGGQNIINFPKAIRCNGMHNSLMSC